MQRNVEQWDIFCAVIDNFGDIGICWRLSRQLVNEHDIGIRLWVDDLVSFQKICPEVNPHLPEQSIAGVIICLWSKHTHWQQVTIPNVVIEALACTIPQPYQERMAAKSQPPLWLNLEYLSAETWVESCHSLASPQPQLAINKYFFFPGFTAATGGLLQEQDLAGKRDRFLASQTQQTAFWHSIGVTKPEQYYYKISLFAYDHSHLADLLRCWQQHKQPILCVVPEGALAEQVQALMLKGAADLAESGAQNNLMVKVLPFLPQPEYDRLLWACDINFVRGEDSIIRAHWAGKPFIWQIYRQQQDAHLVKLQAFIQRYTQNMPQVVQQRLEKLFLAWNSQQALAKVWLDFIEVLPEIAHLNNKWQQQLSENGDLASNLVHFVEKKFIITRNFR